MKRAQLTLALLAALLCWAPRRAAGAGSAASGPDPDAELARVGGHTITGEELTTFFKAFFLREEAARRVRDLPLLQRRQVLSRGRAQALRRLIERRALLQKVRPRFEEHPGVLEEVDRLVEERLRRAARESGSMVALMRQLHERGVSLGQWKDFMAETIMIQQYLWDRVESEVRVRPEQIRRYWRRHREEFRRPRQVLYRLIVVDPAGTETEQERRARAESIRRRIAEGASFAEMAEKHSLDRDRTEGGLRKVQAPEGWLPPVCRGLEPGQLSEVLKTEAGFCIARLEEIRPARVPPFEEVQEEVRRRLVEQARSREQRRAIRELRQEASVTILPAGRKLLGSSAAFENSAPQRLE